LGEELDSTAAQRLSEHLEYYLLRFFHDHSVTLARAFGPDGKGFDAEMPGLQVPKLETLVGKLVPKSEKLRRSQFLVGLRDGLLSLGATERAHMTTLYQKTVAFALLHQDPTVQRVKRRLAQRRIIYLDTNVLMAWMFEAHRRHPLAREVVELAHSVKCQLRVSKFTLEELELQLRESDTKYRQISHREGVLAIVDDDVVRSYSKRRDSFPGLTWAPFLAEFQPPHEWLTDHDVICDNYQDWANAVHDERKDRVRAAVQAAKKGSTHPELIDFDVHNLLYTQLRRVGWRADEMGSRVWFVTLDHGLGRAESVLLGQRVISAPASHGASAWCEFLGPYAVPESQELDAYVTHLVQSQLGLLGEDPKFVETNFLMTLEESSFDVDELMRAGPERARQVLVALQEDREVRRLIGASDDEKRSQEWDGRLAEAVGRALSDIETDPAIAAEIASAKRARDEAQQMARVAKRERDSALRQTAELKAEREGWEERLKALESERDRARRTFLQRLFRR
jgi:FtsZ-binding cell division protein ZapB/predicted nucleic acid-binding protein